MPNETPLRTASDFVPGATSGNATELDITAPPAVVWQALDNLRFGDLRITGVLMGIRSLPAIVTGRGGLRRDAGAAPTILEAMATSRFTVLHREPEKILTLGIVGQFWKPSGGDDAAISDGAGFVEFDQPGFVKSAIDFQLEPHGDRTRVTTETCNRATDAGAARSFRRYWWVIGPGSKTIRIDILRALRRRVHQHEPGSSGN